MRRQTSERFEEISCAILVPLTTIVACSINRRTMRPRRMSVGSVRASAAFARASPAAPRVVLAFLMTELCATPRQNNKSSNKAQVLLNVDGCDAESRERDAQRCPADGHLPDQHGLYRILSLGRTRRHLVNGGGARESLAVDRGDLRGRGTVDGHEHDA